MREGEGETEPEMDVLTLKLNVWNTDVKLSQFLSEHLELYQ